MTRRHVSLWTALALLVPVSLAEAQTAPPPPAPPLPTEAVKGSFVSNDKISKLADKPQGWSYNLKLGANFNLTSNKNVVGQIEGESILVGVSILTNVGYLKGPHEWLNSGSLTEAWSKAPKVFYKSNDLLDVQSLYNYFINAYTGPFLRAQLQTSILNTRNVTPTPQTYVQKDDATNRVSSRKFLLSDAGQPLTISESLGWFYQPVHSDRLNAFVRAGFGGRHTFTDGARALDDDKDTAGVTEFKLLKDVHQGGAELFAGIEGKEMEGRILYNVGATALLPFINNDSENRSVGKLTRVQLQAALGVGIFTWMSLNYQLKVLRDVQMIDAIQITNALLLSFQYAVSSPKPAAPKPAAFPAEAQKKIDELELRATRAEARAAAAEARVPMEPPAPTLEPSAPPPAPVQETTPAAPNTTPAP